MACPLIARLFLVHFVPPVVHILFCMMGRHIVKLLQETNAWPYEDTWTICCAWHAGIIHLDVISHWPPTLIKPKKCKGQICLQEYCIRYNHWSSHSGLGMKLRLYLTIRLRELQFLVLEHVCTGLSQNIFSMPGFLKKSAFVSGFGILGFWVIAVYLFLHDCC